jgi:hypothetical protein
MGLEKGVQIAIGDKRRSEPTHQQNPLVNRRVLSTTALNAQAIEKVDADRLQGLPTD